MQWILVAPVPWSAIVCGEAAAESVICTVADRRPSDAGAKATEIVQFDPEAREAPQLVDIGNSLGLEPVRAMPEIFNGRIPGLESVTVCAALVVDRC